MYLVSKSSNYNETIALNLKVLCEASELLLDQLCLLEHIGGLNLYCLNEINAL